MRAETFFMEYKLFCHEHVCSNCPLSFMASHCDYFNSMDIETLNQIMDALGSTSATIEGDYDEL